jgi:DNA-binding transcriptional ArsR family regulator
MMAGRGGLTAAEDLQRILEVDRLIHEPARLLIVALLASVREADFVFLQRETGLTKGNLSSHLARLEQAGYVRVDKGFRGKIPQTVCSLTAEGRTAFKTYRAQMRRTMSRTGS